MRNEPYTDSEIGEESLYRCLFENAPNGIFQAAPDGTYVNANQAMALLHGFGNTGDLIRERTSFDAFVDPQRRAEFQQLLSDTGSARNFEYQLTRRDGLTLWVSVDTRAV